MQRAVVVDERQLLDLALDHHALGLVERRAGRDGRRADRAASSASATRAVAVVDEAHVALGQQALQPPLARRRRPACRRATRASWRRRFGRATAGRRCCRDRVMTPCCVRLTFSTSRTCGSISPGRKPRSMMPMPPSSAWTIAIGARVTVSMLAETIGRFSVMRRESRHDRSMTAGSRRASTLCVAARG